MQAKFLYPNQDCIEHQTDQNIHFLWNECPTSINRVNEVVNLLPTAKKLKKATLKNFNLLM